MKLNKGIAVLILLFLFAGGCSTPGERLMKNDSDKYNEISGTWYFLCYENPGKIDFHVSFNDDGSISGDTGRLFPGYEKPRWYYNIDSQSLVVFNANSKKDNPDFKLVYGQNKDYISFNKYHNYYSEKIPPLKTVTVESFAPVQEKAAYIFTKRMIVANNLAVEFTDSTNWGILDKKSVKEHLLFLKSVRDDSIKTIAENSLKSLLDEKIKLYLRRHYPRFYKYADYKIHFANGNSSYHFYKILRLFVLSKSSQLSFDLISKGREFEFKIEVAGEERYFIFEPSEGKLILKGYRQGWQTNPRNWELGFAVLAESFTTYPDNELINHEMLDKLQ